MRSRAVAAFGAAAVLVGLLAAPATAACQPTARGCAQQAAAKAAGAPSRVEQRLAELGLALPPVVAPIASYAPAVRSGNLVYTSGQVPVVGGKLAMTGKVGAEVSPEQAAHLAQICALNALAAVRSVVGDLDRVVRVVKVVGYVASAPGFTGQPAVINGASNLLKAVFGDAGVHARSSVGVTELPLGSPVELELIVQVASET